MSDKYIKKIAIARSGIYSYAKQELASMNLPNIPQQYQDLGHFNVYRPAHALAKAAPLFTRLPITVEHKGMVTPFNAKQKMEGLTGDTATVEYHDGEVYINSSATLLSKDIQQYYDAGYKDVSPGYIAKTTWLDKPMTYKGIPYQIIMSDISEVNHLALTVKARGGPTTCVLDSIGGTMDIKHLSGLFHWARKKLKGINDSSVNSVRELLLGVTQDNVDSVVDEVTLLSDSLPVSEGKDKLNRFLVDLKQAKVLDSALLTEMATATADLYDSLDSAAVAEIEEIEKKKEDAEKKDAEKKVVEDDVPSIPAPASEEDSSTINSATTHPVSSNSGVASEVGTSTSETPVAVADYNPGTTATAGAGSQTVKEENAMKITDSAISDLGKALAHFGLKITADSTPAGTPVEPTVVVDSVVTDVTKDEVVLPKTTATMSDSNSSAGIDAYMAENFGLKR